MMKSSAVSGSLICSAFILLGGAALRAQDAPATPGVMRDITPKQFVYDMKVGWNLGNTLDSTRGGETGWGNPKTTQAMIDALKEMGFKTVRIPVTWQSQLGPAPDYTINKEFLDRVEEVVNYVLKDGMYAIVNTHHDGWVRLNAAGQAQGTNEAAIVWSQIATRFKNYSDYLIFETFNEPKGAQNQYSGGTPEAARHSERVSSGIRQRHPGHRRKQRQEVYHVPHPCRNAVRCRH